MTQFKQLLSLGFTCLAASAAACTGIAANDGIHLDTSAADHIAGTFAENGLAVAFDFTRTETGAAVAFSSGDGEPLISTTYELGHQHTDVLGGRLVIDGAIDQPNPTLTGDADAMTALYARPEARLLDDLSSALVDAGVDPTHFAPEPQHTEELIHLSSYALFDQQSKQWFSAPFAMPTTISLWKLTDDPGSSTIFVYPYSGASSFSLTAYSFNVEYKSVRYWWGALFNVTCISSTNACDVYVRNW